MPLYESYLNLITSEHRTRPKYIATVKKLLEDTDPVMELSFTMPSYFDIDNAQGSQLDMIGEQLGKSRYLPYNPATGSSSVLDDVMYRLLLKSTIAKFNWHGGIEELYKHWDELLPDLKISIRDNQDMTMDITLIGIKNPQLKELIMLGYIIPKPQGVRLNIQVSANPVFGYDLDNSSFAGYEKGEWAEDGQ